MDLERFSHLKINFPKAVDRNLGHDCVTDMMYADNKDMVCSVK